MTGVRRQVEDVLRGRTSAGSWWIVVACGLIYGAVMGSHAGRPAQAMVSAVKVPMLLLTTAVLSLPSFFVLNTLLGVRDDFADVLRGLIASQAGLTIILASLAPLTAFWYVSTTGYRSAILFNGAMFAVASLGSQNLLRRAYRPLIARNPRHRLLLRAWLVLYALIGVQMGWVLRPFIGVEGEPVEFLREEPWDNAYVVIAQMIWRLLTGSK